MNVPRILLMLLALGVLQYIAIQIYRQADKTARRL